MDAITTAIATLTTEREATANKLKSIDGAIAALRIGQNNTNKDRRESTSTCKPVRFKAAGMVEWVRQHVNQMPEGHEFTTRTLATLLPPHLSQAKWYLTVALRFAPVDRVAVVRGQFGYITYRKRVTTGNPTPANQQLAAV